MLQLQLFFGRPGEPPQPIENHSDGVEIRRDIIQAFSEHGYEVGFSEEQGMELLELDINDEEEAHSIIAEVMTKHGCVLASIEVKGCSLDSLYGNPDFGLN